MRHLDKCRHLNEKDKLRIELDLEEIVRQVMSMNYGTHRFLSALVRFRLEKFGEDQLARGIEQLLEKDLY